MNSGRMRVLLVSDRRPVDLTHGRDLRIHYLSQELAGDFDLMLVDLSAHGTGGATPPGDAPIIYRSLPPRPRRRSNFLRHFRWSDINFPRKAHPEYFRRIEGAFAGIVDDFHPSLIVNFSDFVAELVPNFGLPAILDWSDSDSLAIKRALASGVGPGSRLTGPNMRLRLHRALRRERHLVKRYRSVTTISMEERDQLLGASGVPENRVTVIPNGVGQAALDGFRVGPRKRSVTFWGNLDFPPNWTAVRFFYEQVFVPQLAEHGIGFHIVGRGGDRPLAPVFADPRVTQHGFVDDLYGLLADQGVMVNPMIQGGGMKNKILEAFACGIPVVTTRLGLDGIDATADVHCQVADDARALADAVMRLLEDKGKACRQIRAARTLVEHRYTWSRSAAILKKLIEERASVSGTVAERGFLDGQLPGMAMEKRDTSR